MRAASIAIVFAYLFVVACGADGSQGGGVQYKIATASARGELLLLAEATGILQGQTNPDGTACFWLGTSLTGDALAWPYGYSARDDPLAVYDEVGNRLATVGQRVTMAGGLMPASVHSITGCTGFTEFWGVGQVASAT